jgi:hypothetical protein
LSSLSDSRALSARAAAKAAASIASERPWPGAPLVAGAAFEVVAVLAVASASARCCRLARPPPFRRFGGCRTSPGCVVVADVDLVTDWGGSGEGRVAGISANTVHCTCASICVALMAASLWCFLNSARTCKIFSTSPPLCRSFFALNLNQTLPHRPTALALASRFSSALEISDGSHTSAPPSANSDCSRSLTDHTSVFVCRYGGGKTA